MESKYGNVQRTFNEILFDQGRGPPGKPGLQQPLFDFFGQILQAFRLICREGSRVIMALRVDEECLKASANYRSSALTNLSSLRLLSPSLGSLFFLFRFNGNAEAKLAVFVH